MTPAALDARPRRPVLSAAELEVIARYAGTGLPMSFVLAEDLLRTSSQRPLRRLPGGAC